MAIFLGAFTIHDPCGTGKWHGLPLLEHKSFDDFLVILIADYHPGTVVTKDQFEEYPVSGLRAVPFSWLVECRREGMEKSIDITDLEGTTIPAYDVLHDGVVAQNRKQANRLLQSIQLDPVQVHSREASLRSVSRAKEMFETQQGNHQEDLVLQVSLQVSVRTVVYGLNPHAGGDHGDL